MDPVLYAFGKKVAAEAPLLRPDLVKRAEHVVASMTASHEDLLPSSRKTMRKLKTAMVHPSMQQAYETMSAKKWRQAFKDIPVAVFASGLGYGIGRTLAEIIGENVARTGQRPGWVKVLPVGTALLSAGGAYAARRSHEVMKKRREEA